MDSGSQATVFWILIPLFLAVGMYLFWYAKRREKMVDAFAQSRGFTIRAELKPTIEHILDHYFALQDDPGVVRSFGQISPIVDGGTVRLFRTVELLDVSPHSTASSTHFSRFVALFEVSTEFDDFFLLDAALHPTRRWADFPKPDPRAVTLAKKAATAYNPRHTLSITLTHGHGLIYFEPLVTGGESLDDLHCLYEIARQLHQQLSEPKQPYRTAS